MNLHIFTVAEKQMIMRGLYMVAQQAVYKVQQPDSDQCTDQEKDSLVELAQDIDSLIQVCFTHDKEEGMLVLHEADALTIYKGLQRLNIYASSIRDLWLKGGCLDQCLYYISLQMCQQVNSLINKIFPTHLPE